MTYHVDPDAADIEIINSNVTKLSALTSTLTSSLSAILSATSSATSSILPVLKDLSRLHSSLESIDSKLAELQDVYPTASEITRISNILSQDIDSVSTKTYLGALGQASLVRKNAPSPIIKQFPHMFRLLDDLRDQAERQVYAQFRLLARLPASRLLLDQDPDPQLLLHKVSVRRDLAKFDLLKHHFDLQGNLEHLTSTYVLARMDLVLVQIRPLIKLALPVQRAPHIPYERGSNKIIAFTKSVVTAISSELLLAKKLDFAPQQVASLISTRVIDDIFVNQVLSAFCTYFDKPNSVADSDVLAFEAVEATYTLQTFLAQSGLDVPLFQQPAQTLMKKVACVFAQYIAAIEAQVLGSNPSSEIAIREQMTKGTSRLRKAAEHKQVLLLLVQVVEAGEWLMTDPRPRFYDVFPAPVPAPGTDETDPAYKLSAFYADAIDALAIDLEQALRANSGEISLKKLTQGLYLLKGLMFLETLVLQTPAMYLIMGAQGMDRLARLQNRFVGVFLDDWKAVLYTIIKLPAMSAGINAQGLFSAADKARIKQLFELFNGLFEEAVRNYERCNIQEERLRQLLRTEIKRLVTSAYYKLYDKYGTSGFAKNMDKYVRYDKKGFERVLNGL